MNIVFFNTVQENLWECLLKIQFLQNFNFRDPDSVDLEWDSTYMHFRKTPGNSDIGHLTLYLEKY